MEEVTAEAAAMAVAPVDTLASAVVTAEAAMSPEE